MPTLPGCDLLRPTECRFGGHQRTAEEWLLDPVILGEFFRYLQAFQALHEAEGIDCLTGPDGEDYCLADLVRLYAMRRYLPAVQAAAIQCLYEDRSDADAARISGSDGIRTLSEHAMEALTTLSAVFEYSLWG